jgi:hypothetical protein
MQTENDPQVKELGAAYAGAMAYNQQFIARQLADRRRLVMNECLRARGAAPAGGVERIKNSEAERIKNS